MVSGRGQGEECFRNKRIKAERAETKEASLTVAGGALSGGSEREPGWMQCSESWLEKGGFDAVNNGGHCGGLSR